MKGKRIIAAKMGNGHIGLIEEDIPPVGRGMVLVEVHNSLVSPGTELGGWHGLRRELDNPNPTANPRPFGYSNAGIVLAVGDGVEEFAVGARVACIGGGFALHTNYAVVPHNLCVALPDRVTFAQGAYAMLAGTALHAMRRGEPQFGEYVAVVGLGVVGQLTAMFYQLAGNFVIGWDTLPFRTEIARKWGIDETAVVGVEDAVAVTRAFTGYDGVDKTGISPDKLREKYPHLGYGLDAAVLAFGGDANSAMEKVCQCLKRAPDTHRMGRIVTVGGLSFNYNLGASFNVDIRRAGRPGPGYHDPDWEVGVDYPPIFMQWTTRTNLDLCMRLIDKGRLKVDCLTTHIIPLDDIDARISEIIEEPDKILGVVFEMGHK